jgi:hypothetical protein
VIVDLVTFLLLGPWLYVILTKASLESSIDDRTTSAPVDRTIRGVHSLLWIMVLLLMCLIVALIPLALIGGAIAAVVPRATEERVVVAVVFLGLLALLVWLAPRLATVIHVFVGEDARGSHAIAEAWRRSRGAWGMAFGVLVLSALIGIEIGLVPALVAEDVFPNATVEDAVPRAIVYAVTSALSIPIGFAVTAALYLEISARKSVLSQASLRRQLARFDARA